MPTTINEVSNFLALRRIAFVGLSRNSKDFSRTLFREMCKRGYDMVPVNPAANELEDRRCFVRLQEIQPPVDGALLLTQPRKTERVVRDCAEAGIRNIWMYRAGGPGAVSQDAVEFCHSHGMNVVEGHCPFMFFPQTAFFHRFHGFLLKLTGGYPRRIVQQH